MICNMFEINKPLNYKLTGKFKAPSAVWRHEVFPLIDYELFVVTEGVLYMADDNGQYRVETGEYLILSPTKDNIRYGYNASDCSFYWLHFTCESDVKRENIIAYSTEEASDMILPVYGALPMAEKVIILMKQLQDSVRSKYNEDFLNYKTTIILLEIYNQLLTTNDKKVSNGSKQIYSDIIDYIKLNIKKNPKVKDIAKHFGYNEKYLSHLFNDLENMPLKQYIIKMRIEQAKYMLTDTNNTVLQISLEMGFADSQSFVKSFKKNIGLTPSEYRNVFNKRLLFDK